MVAMPLSRSIVQERMKKSGGAVKPSMKDTDTSMKGCIVVYSGVYYAVYLYCIVVYTSLQCRLICGWQSTPLLVSPAGFLASLCQL